MKISEKNDRIIKGILIIAAIITVIGMTYALLNITIIGSKNYVLGTNGLKVYLDESKNLTDVVGDYVIPVADYKGLQNDSYVFSIVNDEITGMDYSIYLVLNEENTMPSYGMRYNLVNNKLDLNKIGNIDDENDDIGKLLYSGTIYAKSSHEFKLKLWLGIDAGNDCKEKTFSARIKVTAIQNLSNTYVDNSGANEPELSTGMIPVIYDGTDWIKADITGEWYNYSDQWWANAVTVSEKNRQKYLDAKSGTTISMDDINTMWVWIPRYEYEKITSTTVTEIKVNFLSGTESNKTSNYITHPAFTFGSDELTGIWVAKFEASSNTTCTAKTDDIDTGCDLTSLKVNIKPNVTSWRGIRLSTADLNARNMNKTGNIYGFLENEVDSHVLKGTEWGSVAYLSQSKYGKYGNSNYEGANKEIYQNKSTDFITGMSNGTPSTATYNTQVTYDVEGAGTGASTTGNIYGVYDMSGGSHEVVMSAMKDNLDNNLMSGHSQTQNSGFTGTIYDSAKYTSYSGREWPDSKYYDLYDYVTPPATEESLYSRYIPGDATKETKGWYGDYFAMPDGYVPLMARGGSHSADAIDGIFVVGTLLGNSMDAGSFRITLVQK